MMANSPNLRTWIFTWSYVILSLVEKCTGTACSKGSVQLDCDYGCCGDGDDTECCSISTSVLVVACVVSGLVLLSVLAALIVCCYKSYRDNQLSRVRQLRQQQEYNAPRRVVEPPKPPAYISAPPEYSEEMPESHFRPATVTGHVPANQRYRATPMPPNGRRQQQEVVPGAIPGSVAVTQTSGMQPSIDTSQMTRSHRSHHVTEPLPEEEELPPPYTEFARGQTPARAREHRRFIRTPSVGETRPVNVTNTADTNTFVTNTANTNSQETDHRTTQESFYNVPNTRRSTSTSVPSETRNVITTRDQLPDNNRVESRPEVVQRVLRISRIPTRIMDSLQTRPTGGTVAARDNPAVPRLVTQPRIPRNSTRINDSRAHSIVQEDIEDLGDI
ncbi:hypothetical protein MAR_025404 [Mya arenaria]|uniref:Uncharacterized protein n=1 Tax=Mya arenaria TaxID=6604 RepID=A0ABY7DWQ0_MYAAR|nr:uncharacterized protein LOC128227187 [Mya arenaria]WAR01032.1 hypothetical protein MAR_025404 [Mya arenaria]